MPVCHTHCRYSQNEFSREKQKKNTQFPLFNAIKCVTATETSKVLSLKTTVKLLEPHSISSADKLFIMLS